MTWMSWVTVDRFRGGIGSRRSALATYLQQESVGESDGIWPNPFGSFVVRIVSTVPPAGRTATLSDPRDNFFIPIGRWIRGYERRNFLTSVTRRVGSPYCAGIIRRPGRQPSKTFAKGICRQLFAMARGLDMKRFARRSVVGAAVVLACGV